MEDRRRSQRVMLRVGVVLRYEAEGKAVTLEAFTAGVNSHGAMVCTAKNIPMETVIEVEHRVTKERLSGRVVRQAQNSAEGYLIPIEFESPSGDFWHISFPPSDWKASDV